MRTSTGAAVPRRSCCSCALHPRQCGSAGRRGHGRMTAVEADDGMRPDELRNALRSLPAITMVHHRLHLFSFVLPRPKEGVGDSLQLALHVEDEAEGRALLARLSLENGRE